jgi:putative transposase
MKNRDYKNLGPGVIVHIYNRGNNKEKIFLDKQDYKSFLHRIGLALGFNTEELNTHKELSLPYSRIRIVDIGKNSFRLHAFCLMPNHFHLVIEQLGETSISKLISKICTSYAMYFNKKHGRVGHVFQDQFKSVLIEDDPQLKWVFEYIHMNPVKDKLVENPGKYEWSSFKEILGIRKLPILCRDLHVKDAP